MSDPVKLVTSLNIYSGTLSGTTDQVLVVHDNSETVRVPFEQFKNSQTILSAPSSPTSDGTEGDISFTEDAVYTYINGEWGKSVRDLDWGAEYLRIDQGNVTVTQEQKDTLRDRLPSAEENTPGIVPLAVDHTKAYPTNYAATPEYVANYVKSLNPEVGNADNNPEQPVTMLLRAVYSASCDTTDAQGNPYTYVYKYSTGVSHVSMDQLAIPLPEGDFPIISTIVLYSSTGSELGGYMVTLPRRDADIMAEKWETLLASVDSTPDITYL